jgi:hypothetical protein
MLALQDDDDAEHGSEQGVTERQTAENDPPPTGSNAKATWQLT